MTRLFLTSTAMAALLSSPVIAQSVFELDEIIFTATAQPVTLDRVGTSVTVIDEEALQDQGDVQLADALNRLAGIRIAENGPPGTASQLRIRGAGAEYVSVYIDGILVTDPASVEQSYDNFGGLTAGSVRRVEILRGSQSALYGGTAVAGVISITTVADEDAPLGLSQTAEVQAGSNTTFSMAYGATYATEETRLSFSASGVTSDGFSAADENNGNSEADAYDQARLSFGVEHDINASVTIGANVMYERGSNEFDDFAFVPSLGRFGPADGTPDDVAERETFGARAYAQIELGAWTHDVAITGYNITRDIDQNGAVSNFEGERYTFEYVAGVELSEQLSLSFGLDARDEQATYRNQQGGSNSVQTYGAFAEALWSPNAQLDVTGTFRYDTHSEFGGEGSGRLAIAYRPMEGLTLRGALASGYRAPSLDELFGDYPGSFPFVGNPDLTPETSLTYEMGADYETASGAQFSGTLFLTQIDDLITFQSGSPSTLVNVDGTSERFGVELAGYVPITDRISLTGAYTFTQALDANGDRLANIPRHDLVLGVDADVTDRLSLSTTIQYVADREAGSFDLNDYTDYTLADASITYDLTEELDAFLRVENLFDEEYQTISGYGTPDRTIYVGLRASF